MKCRNRRYLTVDTKGWLGRFVWVVLIGTCFSLAFAISWANVANWRNSPVTVTQAATVMLKDENVSMPTVTLCPRQPDYSSFITNYVNRNYNRTRDPELYNSLRAGLVFEMRKRDHFDRDFAQEIKPKELCNATTENGFVDKLNGKHCHTTSNEIINLAQYLALHPLWIIPIPAA